MREASAQGTHARTEPIRRFCALAQIPFQKELQGHWEAARSPVRGGSSHFLRGLTIVGHSSSSFCKPAPQNLEVVFQDPQAPLTYSCEMAHSGLEL